MAGLVLFAVGFGLTVWMFTTLPEDPPVYVLAYVPPSVLLLAGGILAFGGISTRFANWFPPGA